MAKTLVKTPFKAAHVGSFLRPERLKAARWQRANGEITAEELRQIENQEIKKLVARQKESGLQAVTDGEFRRSWWHFDFLAGLEGVELYEAEEGIQFNGVKTQARGIRVTDKIRFGDHYMVEDFKFLKELAGDDAIAKYTIPSPNMLFFRGNIDKEIYPDAESLFTDLVTAYQDAIKAFYDAGCRYLQLDDTSWSLFFSEKGQSIIRERGFEPEELAHLFADAINGAIADKPDDLTVTMHICRGNFKSTYSSEGGYEGAAEVIFGKLNVDGLFLEFDDERSGGFEPLRYVNRPDLSIVLGLVTSKFPELEDPEAIKSRIQSAAGYVPLEQLCLSPQCGFASTEEGNLLTEEEQWAKVRHFVQIAEDVWK